MSDILQDPYWGVDATIDVPNDEMLALAGIVRIIHRFKLLQDPTVVPDSLVKRLIPAFYASYGRDEYKLPVDSADHLTPEQRRAELARMWTALQEHIEDIYRHHDAKARAAQPRKGLS